MTSTLDGYYLGYDPGGISGRAGANGVAAIRVDGGSITRTKCASRKTAIDAIKWFVDAIKPHEKVRGVGIDTLTYWCGDFKGDRGVDCWLRLKYKEVAGSVVSSNSLRGSMSTNGMFVLLRLRERTEFITETHPKILYFALNGDGNLGMIPQPPTNEWSPIPASPLGSYPRYDPPKGIGAPARAKWRQDWLQEMNPWLASHMKLDPQRIAGGWQCGYDWISVDERPQTSDCSEFPRNDHEWDAMISAWVSFMGRDQSDKSPKWTDLTEMERRMEKRLCCGERYLLFPDDTVEYLWPTSASEEEWRKAWQERASHASHADTQVCVPKENQ